MKERFETWLAPQNDERREVAPLRQLGWAFLLAWVFCVFYTNAAGVLSGNAIPNAGEAAASAAPVPTSIGAALFYAVLPLAASVATLAAIVLAEPRIGSPTSHRPLFVVAPPTAASTPSCSSPSPIRAERPAFRHQRRGHGHRKRASAGDVGRVLRRHPRDRSEWLAPVPRFPPPSSCFWYPPWTAGARRRRRGAPLSPAMLPSRVDAEPPPKALTAHRFATERRSPWRDSGARGSASSSCSPS
ncbi:MAG: hypothetical protein ACLUW6_03485 [Coriobacteriaceae bacterium]